MGEAGWSLRRIRRASSSARRPAFLAPQKAVTDRDSPKNAPPKMQKHERHRQTGLAPVRVLGRGSSGVAKLVRNAKNQLFCLKDVPLPHKDRKMRDVLMQEVSLLREASKHPNVVRLHDSWVSADRLCILMEFCANGSLYGVILEHSRNGERFSALKVQHYLQEMASALAFCHDELRIVHRDLKPANVLIDRLGALKVADFGLSKSLSAPTELCKTMHVGTPLYLSPEQCLGQFYSFPADMWSLGCVAYELMALSPLWSAATSVASVYAMIRKETPDMTSLLEQYPERLVDLTRWMLRRDVSERATAAQVENLLELRPPPKHVIETLAPPSSENVIADIVADARKFLAAERLQASFRVSLERRRIRKATDAAIVHVDPVPLSPVDKQTEETRTSKERKEEMSRVLQKAVRRSLNRRAKPSPATKAGRGTDAPPACSTRLQELATPRIVMRKRNVPLVMVPKMALKGQPTQVRQAWV